MAPRCAAKAEKEKVPWRGGAAETAWWWPKVWVKEGVQREDRRGMFMRVEREGLKDWAVMKEREVAWRDL